MGDTTDPFRGAAALVTGAGSGIGRALTLELVERGAFVHAADLDERAVADLAAAHPAVTAVALDVTDGDAVGRCSPRATATSSTPPPPPVCCRPRG